MSANGGGDRGLLLGHEKHETATQAAARTDPENTTLSDRPVTKGHMGVTPRALKCVERGDSAEAESGGVVAGGTGGGGGLGPVSHWERQG